jgi:hypothetical protein
MNVSLLSSIFYYLVSVLFLAGTAPYNVVMVAAERETQVLEWPPHETKVHRRTQMSDEEETQVREWPANDEEGHDEEVHEGTEMSVTRSAAAKKPKKDSCNNLCYFDQACVTGVCVTEGSLRFTLTWNGDGKQSYTVAYFLASFCCH